MVRIIYITDACVHVFHGGQIGMGVGEQDIPLNSQNPVGVLSHTSFLLPYYNNNNIIITTCTVRKLHKMLS